MLFRTLCLAVLSSGSVVGPTVAQALSAPALQVDAATEAAAAPFETLELSARLARLGRERGDPWLLATAARLRLSTAAPVRTAQSEPAEPASPGGAVDPSDEGTWPQIAEVWLDEAQMLAEGDAQVLAFIAAIRAQEYKGRTGGPLVSLARLPAGQAHVFRERFAPGRPAVVYVEGDGDAPLAVTVKAGKGMVCQAAGPGDVKLCAWTAHEPGDYQVEVRNLGAAANRYAYGTN
ncbi:hypothetical protein SH203_00675 [Brevundimonas sp. SH203]|uniref:hypothetical protein n=1 Tax=Brevundimonas sp. SH203 TaxID=345167 RepID=UPI0009C7EFD4|nr:hypothetical protein [Brevundimonas sp. SH203]GAW40278.1 hypothetical protein SH203_00675 [Brevundimonas sp. SH203]